MTSTVELYEELQDAGVRMSVRGIYIIADAPKGVLNEPTMEWIRLHRTEFLAHVRLNSPCTRCGGYTYVDVPIHAGGSIRRDCADCSRTKGFPVWQPLDGNTAASGESVCSSLQR